MRKFFDVFGIDYPNLKLISQEGMGEIQNPISI